MAAELTHRCQIHIAELAMPNRDDERVDRKGGVEPPEGDAVLMPHLLRIRPRFADNSFHAQFSSSWTRSATLLVRTSGQLSLNVIPGTPTRLHVFRRAPASDLSDGGEGVHLVPGHDALGAIRAIEPLVEPESGDALQDRRAKFLGPPRVDCGFIDHERPRR